MTSRESSSEPIQRNGNKVYELDNGEELILYSRVCTCGDHFKTVDGTRMRCIWCQAKAEIQGEA